MSIGHHLPVDPASPSTVVRVLQANPGLRAHLGSPPLINRKFRVPYLAGSSIDGDTVYIDSQTPELFPKSRVEPDFYYAAHERVEWWLMTRRGMKYFPPRGPSAHAIAHGFEHYRMKLDGIDDERIAQYERESQALVNIDEHLRLPPEAFPPDLYLGPYEAAGDSDRADDRIDAKLLPLLRQAQFVKRAA